MLFLMVTEERKLLSTGAHHERQTIYDRYYSITRLRDRAERYFAGDGHGDLWEGLAQTFRLFRDETAAKRLGLSPLNGELFRSSACRDIESVFCPNKSFLAAMRHLSTFYDNGVRRRVNYAHLDVEEFGSSTRACWTMVRLFNLVACQESRPASSWLLAPNANRPARTTRRRNWCMSSLTVRLSRS